MQTIVKQTKLFKFEGVNQSKACRSSYKQENICKVYIRAPFLPDLSRMFVFVCCSPHRVCIWAAWSGIGWTCVTCSASVCAALPLWSVDGLNICFLTELLNWPRSSWNASWGLFIALTVRVLAGVCVWHRDGVAPHLQHLPVLRPVGAERPAAVSRLALRGGRHGQLVRQDGVSEVTWSSNS